MYDAIVVGARCAGSPTALLLARQGYRVLLLDRASFPSDTLSAHYIHQPGVASLERWGLLEQVAASNCPPAREQVFDVGPFQLRGTPPPVEDTADGYAPRRTVLDTILVEAAAMAGAEVRERFSVSELIMDGERVTGIRGHAAGGGTVTEQARIVIGADGLHSLVARSVQAPTYNVRPALTCAYYSYWSDVALDSARAVPAARPHDPGCPDQRRADAGHHLLARIRCSTRCARTSRATSWRRSIWRRDSPSGCGWAPRTERFRGTADLRNFYRQPLRPRLGVGRGRRLPQGPDHRPGHHRRLP